MVAAALWALALAFTGVGISYAPEGQCGDDNRDAYVAASDRAGKYFAVATLLGAVATPFVCAEAFKGSRRRKVAFAFAGVGSFALTVVLGLITLLVLVVRCLE
jgi:hypothetical protein